MARRRTTLIALVAVAAATLTGTTAARAVIGADEGDNTGFRFVASVRVGADPVAGCTGALIAPQWVITAKSCFGTEVTAGVPATPTTVRVGRTDTRTTTGYSLPVGWLVPHPDRNVALLRLQRQIRDIPVVPLATGAAQSGEQLRLLGYGRTDDTWVPDRLHGATVTAGPLDTSTFTATGADADQAPTCKGDAGGPALRITNGAAQLVGLHHTSGQQGCHQVAGTSAEVTETRVDDLGAWLNQVAVGQCNTAGAAHGATQTGRGLPLADWDGDCRVEIMNQNAAGELHAFRNTGDLTADGRLFTDRTLSGTGWTGAAYPRVLTGDFTGDGRSDIINQTPAGELRIFPGSGNVTGVLFPTRRVVGAGFTTAAYPSMVTGDFNGDGRTDLAARLSNRIQLRVWLSTGVVSADNLLFPAGPSATLDLLAADPDTTSTIGDVIPTDVNGDGRTDVIGRNADGKLYAWASTGVVTGGRLFNQRVLVGSGFSTTAYPRVFVGDFNGDGRIDLINQNTAGVLRVWASTGDVSGDGKLFVSSAASTESLGLTVDAYPRLLTGDIDGDGRTDLIAQATNGGLLAFRATGEFVNGRLFPTPARIVGAGWNTTAYPRIF
jgi:hypothetical protein